MSVLSDNISNGSKSSNVARTAVYSDLDIRDGMFNHPVLKDVIPCYDTTAVKNSVRNLVLSNYYEAPFQPFRGSNVRALLFDNVDAYTATALQREITRVLIEYEPRINRVVVEVQDNMDNNSYDVSINFNIISLNTTTAVNFYLERLR